MKNNDQNESARFRQSIQKFARTHVRRPLLASAALILLAASVGMKAADHNHELCKGFVPENDMNIPEGWKAPMRPDLQARGAGGITEAQFNDVLDRVQKLFTSDVAQAGGRLRINRNWSDGTVNAYAQQSGSTWSISMFGGLARHPEISVEGFALVACHELGHHMGGAPKSRGWLSSWATNEGGSDYYATLKCLRRFFAEDDNEALLANLQVDPIAKEKCEREFGDRQDQLLCLRNSLAAASVAGLFMNLAGDAVRPKFDTPDPAVVSRTNDAHPAAQCRLDTYFAGAICTAQVSSPVSNNDYRQGSCVQNTHQMGWRPRCWFKPN